MKKYILLLITIFDLIAMQTKTFHAENGVAAELLMRAYSNGTIEIVYVYAKNQNSNSKKEVNKLFKKALSYKCGQCDECKKKADCIFIFKTFYAKNIFETYWHYFEQNKFTKTKEGTTSYPDENDDEITIKIANFEKIID